MPSRELRIHPAAILEIQEARLWYERIDAELGERFLGEVERAAQLAMEAPDRWAADRNGRRRIRLQCFPHAIVYEWKEPAVCLLAVAHGSRKPGYWKARRL